MSFFKSLLAKVDEINADAKSFFEQLVPEAKALLPLMTGVATAVETLTGNAALIPITQAAGVSTQQLIDLGANHASATDALTQLTSIASSIAANSGNQDVVNQINEISTKAQSALTAIAPTVSALVSAGQSQSAS